MKVKPSPGFDCGCTACTGALFPVPHRLKKDTNTTSTARYARYTPRVRTLCDDCTTDIHVRGVLSAPLPRAVRWRRTDDNGSIHLCEQHKDHRQETEQ